MRIFNSLKRSFAKHGELLYFCNDGHVREGYAFVQPYRKGLDKKLHEVDASLTPIGRVGHDCLVLTAAPDCALFDDTLVVRNGKFYDVLACCEIPAGRYGTAYIWALLAPHTKQHDDYDDLDKGLNGEG